MSCKDIRLFSRLCLFFLFSWGWMHLVGFSFFNFYSCYSFRDVNLPLFGGIPLFFLLSTFLKMIFRFFFIKSPTKKKKKKAGFWHCKVGRVQRAVVNSLGFCFLSKFERTVSLLGTRNLTPTAMLRVMWRKTVRYSAGRGGGQVVGWRRGSKWSQLSQSCTLTIQLQHLHPLPFPLPSHPDHFTHTHTHTHTHSHTPHTEWNFHTLRLTSRVCLSLSLSLSHTHTHTLSLSLSLTLSLTHTEEFSHLLTQTRAHSCLLCHQSRLKIAWPETRLTSTPLLSLAYPASSPPLPPPPNSSALLSATAQSLQQATVSSFSSNKGWAVTFICIGRYLVISTCTCHYLMLTLNVLYHTTPNQL